MRIYKLRNIKTGLYSTGGVFPTWSQKGKSWSNIGFVKSHLTQFTGSDRSTEAAKEFYKDAYIVELEIVEREERRWPAVAWIEARRKLQAEHNAAISQTYEEIRYQEAKKIVDNFERK